MSAALLRKLWAVSCGSFDKVMDPSQSKFRRNPAENNEGTAVQIRPFPYPYKAALAICNDLDGVRSFAEMKAIHDVLNGRKMTPCGPGLGLEIDDSIHFFSVHPEQDDSLAYFEGLTHQPAADAPALREGLKSGLLDIVHTWGNYSQKGGFFRQHALWAAEELDKFGLHVPVWINHGDRHNFQNLKREDSLGDVRETASRRGDRGQVLEYHADIARRIGVRYVWIKELTPVIGQERSFDWRDWLENGSDLGRFFAKGVLSNASSAVSGRPIQLANRLIRFDRMRDGGRFYEMLRYGDFAMDGSDDLPKLLSLKFLRRLVEVGGACLLYMHLGKGRPSPPAPFAKESYSALERLAQWAQAGDIWVTTASRLCRYVELRQRLKLRAYFGERKAVVEGSFAPAGDLSDPEIAGLTFYLKDSTTCRLKISDLQGRTDSDQIRLVENPPDYTGKISFTVPLDPLPYCWE